MGVGWGQVSTYRTKNYKCCSFPPALPLPDYWWCSLPTVCKTALCASQCECVRTQCTNLAQEVREKRSCAMVERNVQNDKVSPRYDVPAMNHLCTCAAMKKKQRRSHASHALCYATASARWMSILCLLYCYLLTWKMRRTLAGGMAKRELAPRTLQIRRDRKAQNDSVVFANYYVNAASRQIVFQCKCGLNAAIPCNAGTQCRWKNNRTSPWLPGR